MFKSIFYSTTAIAAATLMVAASPAADLDQNGEVSRAEFMAAADTRFAAADKDFNGELTREEMKSMRQQKSEARAHEKFVKTDANGDGVLTEAEIKAAREAKAEKAKSRRDVMRGRMIERFDTDGDGTLSEAERAVIKAERDARKAERRAERDASGEKRPKRGRKARPNPDTDGNGTISRAEYDAMTEALFVRMDVNGDGVLTKGEGKKRGKHNKPGHR